MWDPYKEKGVFKWICLMELMQNKKQIVSKSNPVYKILGTMTKLDLPAKQSWWHLIHGIIVLTESFPPPHPLPMCKGSHAGNYLGKVKLSEKEGNPV